MRITKFTGGMVQTNGYLVETAEGNFLVDAPAGIAEWAEGKGVRIDALFLTHQHYDHVEDVASLQAAGVKVFAWANYSKDLTLESFGSGWGLPSVVPFAVDALIAEGERDMFGTKAKVGYVPGHSADSITFYIPDAGIVFAGDAMFAGSVGRCDLPGGSFELLDLRGFPKREEDGEDGKEIWGLYYVDESFTTALELIDSALLTIERGK